MIERGRGASLAEEPLAHLAVQGLSGEGELESDGTRDGCRGHGTVDHAHAPGRDRLHDAEVIDRLAHQLQQVAVRARFGQGRVRDSEYRVDAVETGGRGRVRVR